MKFNIKILLTAAMLISLIGLSGCSASDILNLFKEKDEEAKQVEVDTDAKKDEIRNFLLVFEESYCDLRGNNKSFWIDYYSPNYQSYITDNGSDVPLMRALAKKHLDELIIADTREKINYLNEHELADDFRESIRLLNLSYDFYEQWLNGNADLIDFQDFKDNVALKLSSFIEAQEQIDPNLKSDYEHWELSNSIQDTVAEPLTNIDNICEAKLSLTLGEIEVIKPAYITIKTPTGTLSRSSDNAFYIFGETSDNCSKIIVEAYNKTAGLYDLYQLQNYNYGDTTFRYGIREDWNNLSISGENIYTFSAYCDNDQIKSSSFTLTLTKTPPSDTYDYYRNYEGEKVQSPTYYEGAPPGATAKCKDGTYSFSKNRSGTCSHHGGVLIWY